MTDDEDLRELIKQADSEVVEELIQAAVSLNESSR